jgi:hypothetical protein
LQLLLLSPEHRWRSLGVNDEWWWLSLEVNLVAVELLLLRRLRRWLTCGVVQHKAYTNDKGGLPLNKLINK